MVKLPWHRLKTSSSSLPNLLRFPISYSLRPRAYGSAAAPWEKTYMAITQELSDAMAACGASGSISYARKLHSRLISTGLEASRFLQNHLLNTYLNCGSLDDARRVFCSIFSPNVFSCNIMINGFSKFGFLHEAIKLFDEMPVRDSTTWNTLMAGYFRNGQPLETVKTFVLMVRDPNCKPNIFTIAFAMKSCGTLQSHQLGLQLHGYVEKFVFARDPQVGASLIDMYVKCGAVDLASQVFHMLENPDIFCWNSMILGYASHYGVGRAIEVFDKMPERDIVSWNTVISLLSHHGREREALSMMIEMRTLGFELNSTTLTCALSACTSILDLLWGKHLHGYIIRSGKSMDVFFGSALVDLYAKCGRLELARRTFDSLSNRNTVSWTALIAGYAHSGLVEEAMKLFSEMRVVSIPVDQFTLATVISSCCTNLDIFLGTQLHSISFRTGYCSSVPVSNALVTMYAKCGYVESAESVFLSMPIRDIISWTSMITAYSQRGNIHKAREYFDAMTDRNVVTWNAMLGAYIQHGNEEEGLKMYIVLRREGSVKPDWVTFATLFRACAEVATARLGNQVIAHAAKLGLDLDTSVANGIITIMPIKPSAEIWGALLGACKIYGNKELAECATKHLFELDTKDSGSYVLLAKIYADAGNVDDSARVRKLMRERGIKKNPGCSWIEVKNTTHVFTADDSSHPQIGIILKKLDELIKDIGAVGYDHKATSGSQGHHSEKLAVAFGLMSLPEWMPIQIMKNLRICCDCHTVMKLISLVTTRELIVRDANRFHHFKGGSCSCQDYW
ncbi:pentatricopeptide repeat-containing protein [Canna indica]|uniref:Pentatricopeptide repeat-containing protein n=1 Tax=Canna indica TaxID=4628 RepID=A0AAQ3Q7N1_9LILI|nr:pentatricopeptide repeat-containing protein [Canna indica]